MVIYLPFKQWVGSSISPSVCQSFFIIIRNKSGVLPPEWPVAEGGGGGKMGRLEIMRPMVCGGEA